VLKFGAHRASDVSDAPEERSEVAELMPMVRRIVGARVSDRAAADDLVQETLVRVLAAADRVQPGMLEPYAIRTARNLIASGWKEQDRHKRNQHRVVDLRPPAAPDEEMLQREEHDAIAQALAHLSDRERRTLLAHEVSGQDTRSLALEQGSTAGAVAAELNRTRARLRVEYLLALEGTEPPTDRCRPVLRALSSGDRRRQREVGADLHVLECAMCARLSEPLIRRGQQREDEVRIRITADGDIVLARQGARELADRIGNQGRPRVSGFVFLGQARQFWLSVTGPWSLVQTVVAAPLRSTAAPRTATGPTLRPQTWAAIWAATPTLMSLRVMSPTATLTRPSWSWVAALAGAAAPPRTTAPANSETMDILLKLVIVVMPFFSGGVAGAPDGLTPIRSFHE